MVLSVLEFRESEEWDFIRNPRVRMRFQDC